MPRVEKYDIKPYEPEDDDEYRTDGEKAAAQRHSTAGGAVSGGVSQDLPDISFASVEKTAVVMAVAAVPWRQHSIGGDSLHVTGTDRRWRLRLRRNLTFRAVMRLLHWQWLHVRHYSMKAQVQFAMCLALRIDVWLLWWRRLCRPCLMGPVNWLPGISLGLKPLPSLMQAIMGWGAGLGAGQAAAGGAGAGHGPAAGLGARWDQV